MPKVTALIRNGSEINLKLDGSNPQRKIWDPSLGEILNSTERESSTVLLDDGALINIKYRVPSNARLVDLDVQGVGKPPTARSEDPRIKVQANGPGSDPENPVYEWILS